VQYNVPRSRYAALSPLQAARRRLERVNAAIARHEEYRAARRRPAAAGPPLEPPAGPSLEQLERLRRLLAAEIARLERADPPDAWPGDRRN
jgi:hypothetical protein